jgi:Asp-tRNA(Asn)/Glu-tRNA(Gln) amidotransferase A subunit family amidase
LGLDFEQIMSVPRKFLLFSFLLGGFAALVSGFEVTDATISSSLSALRNEDITCVEFIQDHIDRVHAYDKTGPSLTSITNMEETKALIKAKALDDQLSATGNMAGR